MKKKTCAITGGAGFTLVELMVTIGLFAILAGIAIPGFSKWLPGYHLKSAARDFFSNLQLAKLEAIKQNINCTIDVDPGWKSYSINREDGTTIKTVSLMGYDDGVFFDPSSTSTIAFNNRGMANSSGQFKITNDIISAIYEVNVSNVGSISLKKL